MRLIDADALKGDDVYESMLKGMATVLTNIYRDLWRP